MLKDFFFNIMWRAREKKRERKRERDRQKGREVRKGALN